MTTAVQILERKSQKLRVVGKPTKRFDGLEKVLGRPLYTTDLAPADCLHLKVVRSTQAHALIRAVNLETAVAYPGVVAIFTAEDIPGINESSALLPDRSLLARHKVRCYGEAIAVIVGRNAHAAEEAAELVKVEYEPLPTVLSPLDALEPDAPRVHEKGNVAKHAQLVKGDVNLGFAQADLIVEKTFRTTFQEPAPLEPEAGLAIPEPDGTITCVGSMQSPHHVQTGVAKILGVNPDRVRIVQAATGGAFGPKSDEMPIDVCGLAALAAVKTGKPALLAYTREESMIAHTKRHPFIIKHKTGVRRDGTFTAWEAKLCADTGAYASLGPLVLIRALFHATGAYVIPHVHSEAFSVYTNNTMAGSLRGFGAPQAMFAAESQIDEIAAALQVDPLDLRLKNMLRPGTKTATSQLVDESCGLQECLDKVVAASDWRRKRKEYAKARGRRRRGIGLAIMYHGNSLGPEGNDYATVHLRVDRNGSVLLRTALTEYGTGASSGLLQIAAEVLGIPLEHFQLERPDTAVCGETGPTVASRTIVIGGRAAQVAAKAVQDKLASVASRLLQVPVENLDFAEGRIFSTSDPSRWLNFQDAVEECYRQGIALDETGHYVAPRCVFDRETSQGTTYLQYTYGAVVAEVEVDSETGWVDILKLTTAYDVGRAVNPLSLLGQIEGGTIQGLGFGIMEELVHKNGIVMNANLGDYYIPTSMDIPQIETFVVEYPGPVGPYGAKAMGEPPIVLPAPAIVNAIYHATGIRVYDLPATPEKVLLALKAKQRKRKQ